MCPIQEERGHKMSNRTEDRFESTKGTASGNGSAAESQKNQEQPPTERQQSQLKYDYRSRLK